MEKLSSGEQNLVALGAALGSNCVPCTEHYVGEARKGGFTDQQIDEAIRLADGVRQVPARNVLNRALGLLFKDANPQSKPMPETERADQGRQTAEDEKTSDREGTRSQSPSPDRKSCCC